MYQCISIEIRVLIIKISVSFRHLSSRVQVGSPVTMKLVKVPQLIERGELTFYTRYQNTGKHV